MFSFFSSQKWRWVRSTYVFSLNNATCFILSSVIPQFVFESVLFNIRVGTQLVIRKAHEGNSDIQGMDNWRQVNDKYKRFERCHWRCVYEQADYSFIAISQLLLTPWCITVNHLVWCDVHTFIGTFISRADLIRFKQQCVKQSHKTGRWVVKMFSP